MNPENVVANRRVSFETASVWAIALTAAIATLVLIPSASIPFLYTKVAILALGGIVVLALFILARLTRGNVVLPPLPLVLAMWGVPLAYLLSGIFSGTSLSAATFGTQLESDTFGFVLVLALLGTLTALAVRRVDQYRSFLKIMSVVFGIVVVLQVLILIVAQFAPNFISPSTSLPGSFADLGMLMGLGLLGVMLALRFIVLPVRATRLLYVGGALGLIVLAVVNSFIVWVLIALAALGLFVEAIMRRAPRSQEADFENTTPVAAESDFEQPDERDSRPLIVSLAVLIVSLFFLIGGSTIGGALDNALHLNLVDVRPSWQSTLSTGGHVYSTSPIFGSGPNTFGTEWLKYRDPGLNSTVFWNVDFTTGIGYVPTSFVTTGLLGALAWLVLFGLFLFYGLRFLVFRASNDPFVRFVSVLSFVGAAYVFILAIATAPGTVVLAAGFISLGVFASTLRFGKGQSQRGIVFSHSPRIGFIIVFGLTLLLLASIVAAYTVVEQYLGQVALTKGANELAAGQLDAATADLNQAILFMPNDDDAYRLEGGVYLARLNAIASSQTLSANDARTQLQAALSAGIQASLTATRLAPNRYQNWVALGTMYSTVVPLGVSGAYDNAKAAFAKAVTLNPSSPQLPYVLAQLEIANKNNKAAETDLVQAIQLKQDFTQAIFLLSQLEVADGDAKDALAAAESAAYFDPTDPTVLFQVGILRAATGDNAGAISALSQAVSANPQYANARYFLAVVYAQAKDYPDALVQLQAVSALSAQNATAVAPYITALQKGTDPFPASTLGALNSAPAAVSGASTTTPAVAQ